MAVSPEASLVIFVETRLPYRPDCLRLIIIWSLLPKWLAGIAASAAVGTLVRNY